MFKSFNSSRIIAKSNHVLMRVTSINRIGFCSLRIFCIIQEAQQQLSILSLLTMDPAPAEMHLSRGNSIKRNLSANSQHSRSLKEATTVTDPDQPILTIIHFNDSYDIQPKSGSRGVLHFMAQLQQLRQQNPNALTLFSGDCLSPSTLTNIKNGWQMVHCLNLMKIDVACFGNHEFDFEPDHTLKLTKACNFPWLLGNVTYTITGKLLGDGQPYHVIKHQGLRVGVMGVAGQDWIGVLNEEYDGLLDYEDCYQFANRTAKYLRQSLRCDIVIALTHMRNGPDRLFPKKVEGVDLVLGGHDHVIMEEVVNKVPVIKSGTNFNNVGLIKMYLPSHKTECQGVRVNFQWQILKVPQFEVVDLQLKKYVDDLMGQYAKYDEVIGYSDIDLDFRFTKIRSEETNYGNFLTDLCRKYYDADACIINSGMVRNDVLQKAGRLTYTQISNIIDSPMVVIKVTGQVLFKALELSVSHYPQFSGQFLFVSGIKFTFDPKKTPRVQQVFIGGKPLDLEKKLTLVTTYFQARGGDSFQMLKDHEMIIDETKATAMLSLLLKFFKAPDTHQQYESIKILEQEEVRKEDDQLPDFPVHHIKLVRKVSVRMGRIKDLRTGFVLNHDGRKLTCICPQVEGRIKCINSDAKDSKEGEQTEPK